MFTLIRIKILTDNKGTRNVPGDMVESIIQNQTSCRPLFQLVFSGEDIFTDMQDSKDTQTCIKSTKHSAEHTRRPYIHIFIISILVFGVQS